LHTVVNFTYSLTLNLAAATKIVADLLPELTCNSGSAITVDDADHLCRLLAVTSVAAVDRSVLSAGD